MSRISGQPAEPIAVEVTGPLSQAERRYVMEKLHALAAYARRPLRRAHAMVVISGNPAAAHRVHISADLDVDGRAVHADAAGDSVRESVDRVRQRLYARLVRQRSFSERVRSRASRSARRNQL